MNINWYCKSKQKNWPRIAKRELTAQRSLNRIPRKRTLKYQEKASERLACWTSEKEWNFIKPDHRAPRDDIIAE